MRRVTRGCARVMIGREKEKEAEGGMDGEDGNDSEDAKEGNDGEGGWGLGRWA